MGSMMFIVLVGFFLHRNSPSESARSLATPTTKRKNLLLQHLQRSSMDTEALEMEDMHGDQVCFLRYHLCT